VLGLREPLHTSLEAIEEQIVLVEKRLEEMTRVALPKGMGAVIFEQMEPEVCDWSRFESRKQVGSYLPDCVRVRTPVTSAASKTRSPNMATRACDTC
jgi:hypothetical protein